MIDHKKIKQAANILRAGGLVAFPTETVYGLGADAMQISAVKKIFEAKGRPYSNPLIVHIGNIRQLQDWVDVIPDIAFDLAHRFWPGPLTLVMNKKSEINTVVTGGQQTIALRIPNHPVALALIDAFGSGIAAPSANKFTHLSPTSKAHVFEELGDKVDLILDGGDCALGLESTIIDLSVGEPTLLRPGTIHVHEIEAQLRAPLNQTGNHTSAPGQHPLHYSPRTKTLMISAQEIKSYVKNNNKKAVYLTFSGLTESFDQVTISLMPKDPRRYAQLLYRTLRSLDAKHFDEILIEEVPSTLDWLAISDRLKKASMHVKNTDAG